MTTQGSPQFPDNAFGSSPDPYQQPGNAAHTNGADNAAGSGKNPTGAPQSPLEALRARQQADGAPQSGTFRVQNPDTAVPREPSLAESRERDRVRREAAVAFEQALAQKQQDEQRKRRRKTMLISGGVGLGLVGVLAASYIVASNSTDSESYEQAQCVNEDNIVVDDRYCSDNTNGSVGPGGMFLFFVAGNSYRYSYGSNAPVGSPANGSIQPQAGKNYANTSGNQVTKNGSTGGPVNRGGLGSSSGSKNGTGSRGGSSGS